MAGNITTVEGRSKLTPRRSPYWHKLSSGCHVGFRKMAAGSSGSWLVQSYDQATQKQSRKALGTFDALPEGKRFDVAKKEAEAWCAHVRVGGSAEVLSVKQACEQYVAHVRADRGDTAANDIEARFKRWVYSDKVATIALPKLARHHVDEWRRALAKTVVVVNPHAEEHETRARAPASINRDMTALRAALNHAHDNGAVTTDMAWRVALRPIANAVRRRNVYLDRDQRKALIAAARPDVADFLRALSLVPLRPGALAALTVGQFDKRLSVVSLGKDKAGADRKIKLPESTAAFFVERAKNKLPTVPLLARADGAVWTKDAWKSLVKDAVKAAGLPDNVTAYTLRHSAITDIVTSGLDLLTTAQLSGTSVAMIERHYGHLRADHAAAALATLAL